MSEPETYSFNVGGRIFEVRRSLLESFPQTMLARSASEAWNQQQEKPIFIDRDSDLFRYCLNYMRNGQRVQLPYTESKAALLEEMEYYGFQDVDPSSISIDLPVADALHCLSLFDKRTMADIAEAELRVRHMVLARNCFVEYKNNFQLKLYIDSAKHEESYSVLHSNEFGIDLFNDCLEQYGLRCVERKHILPNPFMSKSEESYHVLLEILPKMTSKTSKDSDTDF